jgi:hypothetical protein
LDADPPSYGVNFPRRFTDKLVAAEKPTGQAAGQRPFDQMFELAMAFLANPWKLWVSERLEDKRTCLKLLFKDHLEYHRNDGVRTAKTTLPFNILGGLKMPKCEMARPKGFEPLTPRFVVWCSIQLSYGRAPSQGGRRGGSHPLTCGVTYPLASRNASAPRQKFRPGRDRVDASNTGQERHEGNLQGRDSKVVAEEHPTPGLHDRRPPIGVRTAAPGMSSFRLAGAARFSRPRG